MPKPRTIIIGDAKTSVSLENEFWLALTEIAARERVTPRILAERIQAACTNANVTSALRVFIIAYYRVKANRNAADQGADGDAVEAAIAAVRGLDEEEAAITARRRHRGAEAGAP